MVCFSKSGHIYSARNKDQNISYYTAVPLKMYGKFGRSKEILVGQMLILIKKGPMANGQLLILALHTVGAKKSYHSIAVITIVVRFFLRYALCIL